MQGTPLTLSLERLALDEPHKPALHDDAGPMTRADLCVAGARAARALHAVGIGPGDLVTLLLPNDRRALIAALACWNVGATPQLVSPALPEAELARIVAVGLPALVIDVDWLGWHEDDATPLPHLVSPSWKAPTSGGSTGTPKVVLSTVPGIAERVTALAPMLRLTSQSRVLIPVPLFHNGAFQAAATALLMGATVVLLPRFDARRAADALTSFSITWIYAVPTVMSRLSRLADDEPAAVDLSSVLTLFHMAAPCAPHVKRWWIDRLGADRVWELYAGTEAQAITVIDGRGWLARPGSVGRVVVGEITVLDDGGRPAAPGVVGEIWLRSTDGPSYRYLGAQPRVRAGGWESLGDLGHQDHDGYLYLADRKSDMVLVGGANVYPAEVEAALEAHPQVLSACVVGLPDPDLGSSVLAVVQLDGEISDEALAAHAANHLLPYKRPRRYARVSVPLRNEAGKVRRQDVRERFLTGAAPR